MAPALRSLRRSGAAHPLQFNALLSRSRLRPSIALLLALMLLSPVGLTQQAARVEIPSTFNPVGSGARALGLGGAFIATADDATAASWNPANLIRLTKPEVAIVGAGRMRTEDNTFETQPEASGEQDADDSNLNYLAASVPCGRTLCGRNMVFSLNYQHLFEFDREWSFALDERSDLSDFTTQQDYVQAGQIYALGLAYAIQLSPRFYLGLTLNFWEDLLFDNEWSQTYDVTRTGTSGGDAFVTTEETRFEYDFSGFNFNIGARWEVLSQGLGAQGQRKVMLGAVFKSEFDADVTQRVDTRVRQDFVDLPDDFDQQNQSQSTRDQQITIPMSVGVGLAFQANRHWTTAIDVTHTRWSDFVQTDQDGTERSPLSGVAIDEADIPNTTQVRLGTEYRRAGQGTGLVQDWRLRLGGFYDPAPADGETDDFYGLSAGAGLLTEYIALDLAYQYRFGRDVGQSALKSLGFSQDVDEHTVYLSTYLRY